MSRRATAARGAEQSLGESTDFEVVQRAAISNVHPVEIDESRLGERPSGISEDQWRAKLVYEAHQAERAAGAEPLTVTSTTARDAALEVHNP